MPSTSTIPQSPTRPARPHAQLPLVVAAVIASGLLLLQVSILLEAPARIDGLTLHNETDYHLNTTLRDSPDGSRLLLGQVTRNTTKTIRSVLDPGETFVFELSYAGVEAGTITVSRAALEANDWQLTIPAEQSEPLGASGLTPPPA